jgi:hypothetical protein
MSIISAGYEFESALSSPTKVETFRHSKPLSYGISSNTSTGVRPSRHSSGILEVDETKVVDGPSRVVSKPQNGLISFYQSLSWLFGFKEKYSLVLFFICGGALLGFCLARAYMMNNRIMLQQTVPGEFRWFQLPMYRINYIIHIYLTIVGGILVGLQFMPAIRRKSVLLHRVNGYTCLILLIVGNISGGIISRRAFGGEINAQSAYYVLAIMLIFSALMGYWYVKKNTRAHRKWMLRSVVYFSAIISARLIMLAARLIVTEIGTYYSLWRCDEVLYVLKDENVLLQMFPQCTSPTPTDNGLYVAVHASVHEGPLGTAAAVRVVQGMSLWLATILHMALVETYIRSTESENYSRHGFVLEPRDYDSEKSVFSPRSSYL